MTIYARENKHVFFIFPAIAFGYEPDGTFFIEADWLHYTIGIAPFGMEDV